MPKIDLPVKRLLQRRPADWVQLLVPHSQETWVKPFKTEYTPKVPSKLDDVYRVEDPERGNYLVQLEPMGYKDEALPIRMLRYRSDIWEAVYHEQQMTPSILQAVIYFYPEHDHGRHGLRDSWQEELTLSYTYRVIRVWELQAENVEEQKWVGLYPLLPLMKREAEVSAEEVIHSAIEVVRTVPDEAFQQDLLAVMGILAGGKYPAELVYSMIRRDMIMQSPIYQDWVKEEREEWLEKGKQEGLEEGKKQGLEAGKKQGLEAGIRKGKLEEKLEVARNMLKDSMDITKIAELTGLSEQQVEELRKDLHEGRN